MSLAEQVAVRQHRPLKKARKARGLALPKAESTAFVAITGLLTASLLIYVLSVTQEARLNSDQLEIMKAREINVRLRAELARRQAPDLVEGRAIKELGLAKPSEVVFAPQASIAPSVPIRPPRLVAVGVTEGY